MSENEKHTIEIGRSLSRLAQRRSVQFNFFGSSQGFGKTLDWYWKNEDEPVVIDLLNEPNPHVLIVGMSGYGKSTLCKSLILEICKAGKKILVFDVHNEHTDAIGAAGGKAYNALYAGINIFALDGVTVSERIGDLVSLFTNVYGLGGVQSAQLAVCLWYVYKKFGGAATKNARDIKSTPTMADLINELVVFERFAKSQVERQGLNSMRNKFMPLNNQAFNANFFSLDDIRKSSMSISLAQLKNEESRRVYISEMLKRLYLSMKESRREIGVQHYIMMDEAQFLIGSGIAAGDMVKSLIEEGRKYGVGLIIATHSASNLDKQIVANASTFISFYSREPDEVDYIAKLFGGGHREVMDGIKGKLMDMGKHEALVMNGCFDLPVLAKTLSAREVNDVLADIGYVGTSDEGVHMEEILGFAYLPVLEGDILKKFGDAAKALLQNLVAGGRICSMTWQENGGEELWYMAYRPNLSIKHELHIRKMDSALNVFGVPHVVSSTGTNKPDIIAFARGGWKVAVEYETGSKTDEDTQEMLTRRVMAYQKTFVVVADEHYDRYFGRYNKDNVVVMRFCELSKIAEEFAAHNAAHQKTFKEGSA